MLVGHLAFRSHILMRTWEECEYAIRKYEGVQFGMGVREWVSLLMESTAV